MDIYSKHEETSDKYWERHRQIALYDDQLKKAMGLLGRVKTVHAAAIRNGDAAVSSITSRLLHEIEKLEGEISKSERRYDDGEKA
jgi:predicted RNA-binding protein with PIN domain